MTDKLTCGRLSTCELCSRCLLAEMLFKGRTWLPHPSMSWVGGLTTLCDRVHQTAGEDLVVGGWWWQQLRITSGWLPLIGGSIQLLEETRMIDEPHYEVEYSVIDIYGWY